MLLIMKACPIHLTADEESSLNSWVRNENTEQRLAMRARIILAAASIMQSSQKQYSNT